MNIDITPKQQSFMTAKATEVLFGGAAGGGKSYSEVIDAFLYALKYPKSKQIILRRTYPDLARSIIRTVRDVYPRDIFSYNDSLHVGKFINGSVIDFGYCANEADVYQYQGAEYDVIRFDELTQFTEFMYLYLMSRLRGANSYPKQIKSTSNPGGVGHVWVKKRFIDGAPANTEYTADNGSTRIFIPSKVQDNPFLMQNDADYVKRLEDLPEKERKALLLGDWDIFEGQYFSEFNREIHVIKPFDIPEYWRRYVAIDYGLDCLAVLWIAVDERRNAFVYKEIKQPNLIISAAAAKIREQTATNENVREYLAPPDLWSRQRETGKCTADLFYDNGIRLTKVSNNRVSGWLAVKEYLKIFTDEKGEPSAKLHIFDNCVNLIADLPQLQHDAKNPSDCATEPHEITHITDSLRYFAVYWTMATQTPAPPERHYNFDFERPRPNPIGQGTKIQVI